MRRNNGKHHIHVRLSAMPGEIYAIFHMCEDVGLPFSFDIACFLRTVEAHEILCLASDRRADGPHQTPDRVTHLHNLLLLSSPDQSAQE